MKPKSSTQQNHIKSQSTQRQLQETNRDEGRFLLHTVHFMLWSHLQKSGPGEGQVPLRGEPAPKSALDHDEVATQMGVMRKHPACPTCAWSPSATMLTRDFLKVEVASSSHLLVCLDVPELQIEPCLFCSAEAPLTLNETGGFLQKCFLFTKVSN